MTTTPQTSDTSADFTIVVAAAIVDSLANPKRVLAARRSRPAALAGRWEFPGGKVEAGESQTDALHRELAEELGVEVVLGAEIPSFDGGPWPITDRHRMRLWLAEIAPGSPQPQPLESHEDLRWLGPDTLGVADWLDGDLQILPTLRAILR